jgi:hypothetical protein
LAGEKIAYFIRIKSDFFDLQILTLFILIKQPTIYDNKQEVEVVPKKYTYLHPYFPFIQCDEKKVSTVETGVSPFYCSIVAINAKIV